ncbi:6-phospho-3-hexuloisomerase [Microbacterium sp. SSM24]|uniref:6-phospho-3-hexuloisomerase n=1 Tax=Microbacterium sp. SSM24 TaxID=2991714 RepID=UPI0022267A03|nr:6-phospho-3-hexuloisomerase [Microbacterium sp. SSM24]MCW3492569.1 SIS domain-containing protein [Microbacterium sp. SSM24]
MTPTATAHALQLIDDELSGVTGTLATERSDQIAALAAVLQSARRVFVFGLGRSGLALQMTGMRLMHVGLAVHIVGDATTPAIGPGDVLFAASGSGTTGGIVRAADNAVKAGARVVAITANPDSPLAAASVATVVVPAAGKLDRSGAKSAQYAGSLFEQSVVVIGDAVFHTLWLASGETADDLWPRHSNLE